MDTNGRKPTVISTFAGTGGSSLGYHWAGFKELLAIDFDAHAVECFKLNFPEVPIWHRSVIEVTGKEILDFCKLKVGELDVFDGSPPCQGFSTAGKREFKDPRNDLFNHYCRLVNELQPKVFVMENVSGMAKGSMKGKFIEIMQVLKSMNYEVKCKQMNAMYYGVPQSRQRLIFIGVRKNLKKLPAFPIPSNKIISVRKALEGLEPGTEYGSKPCLQLWKYLKPGQNASSLSSQIKKQFGYNSIMFGLSKVDPNKPLPTLQKSTAGAAGFFHWNEKRRLYITELKRLCSFPDDWKLTGSESDKQARLGNAVMPKFMQAIAETIKKDILIG